MKTIKRNIDNFRGKKDAKNSQLKFYGKLGSFFVLLFVLAFLLGQNLLEVRDRTKDTSTADLEEVEQVDLQKLSSEYSLSTDEEVPEFVKTTEEIDENNIDEIVAYLEQLVASLESETSGLDTIQSL